MGIMLLLFATAIIPNKSFGRPIFIRRSVVGRAKTSERAIHNTPQISPIKQRVNDELIDIARSAMDSFFENRSITRIYALETIARVPYFANPRCCNFIRLLGDFENLHISEFIYKNI